jgi:hypothetical protein
MEFRPFPKFEDENLFYKFSAEMVILKIGACWSPLYWNMSQLDPSRQSLKRTLASNRVTRLGGCFLLGSFLKTTEVQKFS